MVAPQPERRLEDDGRHQGEEHDGGGQAERDHAGNVEGEADGHHGHGDRQPQPGRQRGDRCNERDEHDHDSHEVHREW
jgi:hypothetical protein